MSAQLKCPACRADLARITPGEAFVLGAITARVSRAKFCRSHGRLAEGQTDREALLGVIDAQCTPPARETGR